MECTLRFRALRYFLLLAAALLLWGYATKTFAATLYYIGRTNGRWESRANWSATPQGSGGTLPAAAPGISDIAVLNASGATVTLRSNVRVGGLVLANSWTGSLVMGSGSLFAGTSGIKIGSGRLIGGINPLTTSGSYTQSGGIVTGLQNLLVMSGSFTIKSAQNLRTQFTATGTIVFDGNAQQNLVVGSHWVTATIANLGLDNPDVGSAARLVHLAGSGLTLTGNVTITGGVLDLSRSSPAQAMTVAGNISLKDSANARVKGINNITLAGSLTVKPAASFAMTGGTMTLNGTTQTLSGAMTFSSFQKLVSSADTLYFYPGYTYTMNGTIVAGQTTNTVLLSLKSSVDGKQWTLSTAAALTLTKVALKDSYNTRGVDQVCQDCTNSGNNSRWDFETSPTVTPGTTSASSGGGGGGGGRRSTTAPAVTTPAVTTPAPTTPATTTTAPTSERAKTLQKRIDSLQKQADKAKGAKQKGLLKVIQRLQKSLGKIK